MPFPFSWVQNMQAQFKLQDDELVGAHPVPPSLLSIKKHKHQNPFFPLKYSLTTSTLLYGTTNTG